MDNDTPLTNTEEQQPLATTPQVVSQQPVAPPVSAPITSSQFSTREPHRFKKLAINTMIGSLVGSALIAVIAVLVGEFNDTFQKALFTLLIVTAHSLACLGFLGSKEKDDMADSLKFFTNTIFVLIVLSFLTAVFGIWELLPGDIVAKLYGTYFIAAFATFHGEMLHKTTGVESKINNIVYGNYGFMAMVIILILPIIWLGSTGDFPDFYYRLLAATAIVDATLTVLAVIFHKLYLQKHPKTESQLFAQGPTKRRMHPLLVVLIIFLALQFILPIVFFIGSLFLFR